MAALRPLVERSFQASPMPVHEPLRALLQSWAISASAATYSSPASPGDRDDLGGLLVHDCTFGSSKGGAAREAERVDGHRVPPPQSSGFHTSERTRQVVLRAPGDRDALHFLLLQPEAVRTPGVGQVKPLVAADEQRMDPRDGVVAERAAARAAVVAAEDHPSVERRESDVQDFAPARRLELQPPRGTSSGSSSDPRTARAATGDFRKVTCVSSADSRSSSLFQRRGAGSSCLTILRGARVA